MAADSDADTLTQGSPLRQDLRAAYDYRKVKVCAFIFDLFADFL